MSDAIKFVLDGEIVDVSDVDPTMTVLQFLRRRLRRTGTRKVAQRAIAVPARWQSVSSSATRSITARSTLASRFFQRSMGASLSPWKASDHQKRCIRFSKQWSIVTARNAGFARRDSSCRYSCITNMIDQLMTAPYATRLLAICADAPVMARSSLPESVYAMRLQHQNETYQRRLSLNYIPFGMSKTLR